MIERTAKTHRKHWAAEASQRSRTLDLDPGIFTWRDPRRIARALKRAADQSKRRKVSSLRSAMSMLVFYVNRAGRKLDPERLAILNEAKSILRDLYRED